MGSKRAKLSIVIPVYNIENYLPDCLDSILANNNLDSVEIVLVNDGSTDKSERICKSYMQRFSKIIYIKIANSGLSEARNTGLKHATGERVWFVDGDDMISEDAIEEIVQSDKHDITMIGYMIQKNNSINKMGQDIVENSLRKYLINTPIVPIRIFNKEFLDKIHFKFERGRYYEDSGSMYGLVKYTSDIVYLDRYLYVYRKRSGSITTDNSVVIKAKDRFWAADMILQNVPEKYRDERTFQIIKTLGLFYSFDLFDNNEPRKRRNDQLHKIDNYLKKIDKRYWDNKYLRRKTITMRMYRLYLKCLSKRLYIVCRIMSSMRKKIV